MKLPHRTDKLDLQKVPRNRMQSAEITAKRPKSTPSAGFPDGN